jgi:hypothetical protein
VTVVGVTAGQLTVEQAMKATLERWLPDYVVAAARRYAAEGIFDLTPEAMEGLLVGGEFPYRPRGVTVTSRFVDWPIDALPHVQVLSPAWSAAGGGQAGRTDKFQLQVACVVGAQTQDDTRLLRACYEDAIKGLVDQHQKLGGVAAGVDRVGGGSEQFDEVSEDDARTFQGSIAVFEVTVENVIDATAGPSQPSEGAGVPEPPEAGVIFEADGDEVTLVPKPID